MNRRFKFLVGPGLAVVSLGMSVVQFVPPAYPAEAPQDVAAAAAGQPQQGQATASPTAVDPKSLPTAGPASAGAQQTKTVPILSPDAAARDAAQKSEGAAVAAASDQASPAARAAAADLSRAAAGPAAPGVSNPVNLFEFDGQRECVGDLGGLCWIPPDQALAVGPTNLLEANNEKLEVFDKSGNPLLGPVSLQAWFGTGSGSSIFDPVALYRGGHFYLVALDNSGANSTIFLSVSTTNSATGGWCNYGLNGKLGTGFADFPKMGVTVDLANSANSRIIISTNQFDSGGNFTNNFVQELPKASLDACAGFSYSTFAGFTDANDNSIAFTLVPVLDLDNDGGNGWYLETARFGGASGITVWRNRFGTGFERFLVGTQAYSNPPRATQPTTSITIDTIDDRLQTAVKRYEKTWATHTSRLGGCGVGNDTAVVHAFDIFTPTGATAPSLVTVTGPFVGAGTRDYLIFGACGTHQYNPSGGPDRDGNFLFDYSESGSSEFASMRFGGYHLERGLIFGGFVGPANPGFIITQGRFGDYSSSSLDPADNRFTWVASETQVANDDWGTRIGILNNGAAGIP